MDAGCRLHFSSLRMRVPECRYPSLVIASEVIGREGPETKKRKQSSKPASFSLYLLVFFLREIIFQQDLVSIGAFIIYAQWCGVDIKTVSHSKYLVYS
jgi:hypothetical protein